MILLIDNYDSFVYNLARHVGMLGHERRVVRNDEMSIAEIAALAPEAIILSPGPCTPRESGICIELIRALGPLIPMLGVCLGHQCIGEAFGGRTVRARRPMHGMASNIDHSARGLFIGLPSPLRGGRYHSLVVDLPANGDLMITATSDDGEIMGIKHCTWPIHGIQFHPESILTEYGLDILRNFVTMARSWNAVRRRVAG